MNSFLLHAHNIRKGGARVLNMQSKKTDPEGSYTGVPDDPEERPVQDVDDL